MEDVPLGMGRYESRLLSDLYVLRAATLSQLVRLHAPPAADVYRVIRRLEARGLVRVKVVPWDRRQRYAVLTRAGYELAAELAEEPEASAQFRAPRSSEVHRLLLAAEFYSRAVAAGLPRTWLLPRRQLLARLGVDAREVPFLLWLVVDAADQAWAVHIPWKRRYRARLDAEIGMLSWVRAQHHVVFMPGSSAAARLRGRYLSSAPASGLHVLDPRGVERWAAWLAAREDVEADLGPVLRAAFPAAEVLPAPPASPGACLLRLGSGEELLVVDLRHERVGAAAAAERALRAGLVDRSRGEGIAGVLYVFASVRQMGAWARRLRQGSGAVVEEAPGAAYRILSTRAAREPAPG